jgi:imidazolonepropionase-like amidohydrolase
MLLLALPPVFAFVAGDLIGLAPALLARLAPKATGPVVFNNVRLYDADQRRFRDGMTVVVEGGRISQIVEANEPIRLVNARVIDGTAKTLVPGLWDSHHHTPDRLRRVLRNGAPVRRQRRGGSGDHAGGARRSTQAQRRFRPDRRA